MQKKKKWFFRHPKYQFLIMENIPKLIDFIENYDKFPLVMKIFPKLIKFTTYFRDSTEKKNIEFKKNFTKLAIFFLSNFNNKKKKKKNIIIKNFQKKFYPKLFTKSLKVRKSKNYSIWHYSPFIKFLKIKFKIFRNEIFLQKEIWKKKKKLIGKKKDFLIKNILLKNDFSDKNKKNVPYLIKIDGSTKIIQKIFTFFFKKYNKHTKQKNKIYVTRKKNNFMPIKNEFKLLKKKKIYQFYHGENPIWKRGKTKQLIFFNQKSISVSFPFRIFSFFLQKFPFKKTIDNTENFLIKDKKFLKFFFVSGKIIFDQKKVQFIRDKQRIKRNCSNLLKNYSFLLFKESCHEFLIFDRDFSFSFILSLKIKNSIFFENVNGMIKLEKIKKRCVNFCVKKEKKCISRAIKFFIFKDLYIYKNLYKKPNFFDRNLEIFFPKINKFVNVVLAAKNLSLISDFFFKDSGGNKISNYFNEQKVEIKKYWSSEMATFFWKNPVFDLWKIDKSKTFYKKFLRWSCQSKLKNRKIFKIGESKKKKENILFNFKKWAKEKDKKSNVKFSKGTRVMKKKENKLTTIHNHLKFQITELSNFSQKSNFMLSIQKIIIKNKKQIYEKKKNNIFNLNFKHSSNEGLDNLMEDYNYDICVPKAKKNVTRVGFIILIGFRTTLVFLEFRQIFCLNNNLFESKYFNFSKKKKQSDVLRNSFFMRKNYLRIFSMINFFFPNLLQDFVSLKILSLVRNLSRSILKFEFNLKIFEKNLDFLSTIPNQNLLKKKKEKVSLFKFLFLEKNENFKNYLYLKNLVNISTDISFKNRKS